MATRSEGRSRRGFAAMDEAAVREIARMGGRAAHRKGVAHEWNSQEAAEAGRKGGRAGGKKARASYDYDKQQQGFSSGTQESWEKDPESSANTRD